MFYLSAPETMADKVDVLWVWSGRCLWVFDVLKKTRGAGRQKRFPALDKSWEKHVQSFFCYSRTSTVSGQTDAAAAPYLCSCILRVMTWWTSCNISATVASGASVTQDRGTGFHLPTWIKPGSERTQVKGPTFYPCSDLYFHTSGAASHDSLF